MNVVELASFELNEEVKLEEFLAISKTFQKEFVEKQEGFIQRKLIKKDERWCDLVIWEDMSAAEKVSKNMGTNEAAGAYGMTIKPGTVNVEHYEVYQ